MALSRRVPGPYDVLHAQCEINDVNSHSLSEQGFRVEGLDPRHVGCHE